MVRVLASSILFALALAVPALSHSGSECLHAPTSGPLTPVHHFSDGTWAENLFLRADGSVLVTLYEGGPGQLALITPRPNGPVTVQVVHRFDDHEIGASGITELSSDVFYFSTIHRGPLLTDPPPGTGQIWTVDLRDFAGSEVPAKLISNLTESIFLNGLTVTQHEPRRLLSADSQKGVVWWIDPETGAYDISANDTLLHYTDPTFPLGVNGIHVKGDFVYFTNTQQRLFARYLISALGLQTGPIEIIKDLTFTGVDDFTVFPGPLDAVLVADDPGNGTFFRYQNCTKRLATTPGTTSNKVAWSQLKPNGLVPVFITSEGGVAAYENPGAVKVGGTLSMFEMNLGGRWYDTVRESLDQGWGYELSS